VIAGISVLTLRFQPPYRPGRSSLQEVQPALVHGVSGGASTAPAEGYTAKAARRGIAFAPSEGLPVVALECSSERIMARVLSVKPAARRSIPKDEVSGSGTIKESQSLLPVSTNMDRISE
jgi:hypothetical protein